MIAKKLNEFQRALQAYRAQGEEEDFRIRMLALLQQGPLAFSRELLEAHFTASAWILETSTPSVVLLHHHKLDRWLQPGGHADGEIQLGKVACKEAQEETGLLLPERPLEAIFDLDIHRIPGHKAVAAHDHYDVRYLFLLPQQAMLRANHESRALAWVSLDEVAEKTSHEPSILRLIRKSRALLHGRPTDL